MPTHFTGIYRDNVAALITRGDGRVLIGECSDKPGTWSFPQGGVDDGETRREALAREMQEEVGLRPRDYKILGSRANYAYAYPPGRLKKGIYRGQVQTYFLCRLGRKQPRPDVPGQRVPEFLSLRWVPPSALDLRLFPSFKREVIRHVMRDFFLVRLILPKDAAPDPADSDPDPEIML